MQVTVPQGPNCFVTTAGTVIGMSYHKIVQVNLTELGFCYERLNFAPDERRLVPLT